MKKNIRFRCWSCVSYLTEEKIINIISNWSNVRNYAYVFHDKDIKDDGTLKTPHYHIILVFYDAVTQSSLEKHFYSLDDYGKPITLLSENVTDKQKVFEYLIHKNNPEKYQYSIDIVKCFDSDFFKSNDDEENRIYNMVDDFLSGKPIRECLKIYGKDFLYHYSQIKLIANDILQEENTYKSIDDLKEPYQIEFEESQRLIDDFKNSTFENL